MFTEIEKLDLQVIAMILHREAWLLDDLAKAGMDDEEAESEVVNKVWEVLTKQTKELNLLDKKFFERLADSNRYAFGVEIDPIYYGAKRGDEVRIAGNNENMQFHLEAGVTYVWQRVDFSWPHRPETDTHVVWVTLPEEVWDGKFPPYEKQEEI